MNDIIATVYEKGSKAWHWNFVAVYPIMMTLGFVLSFLSAAYFWRRQKYSWDSLQIILIVVVPSSIFGARAWYIMFPPDGQTPEWSQFFKFEGLAIQGGVMASAAAASIAIYFMRYSIDYRTAFGIILPAVIIGQAIGRWGNFANHEVFGSSLGETFNITKFTTISSRVTSEGLTITQVKIPYDLYAQMNGDALNWLTFVKPQMLISINGEVGYRQPFFFYESMLNFLGYFVLLWTINRKNWFKPGIAGALYFAWYGVTRLIMEPLRDNSDILRAGSVELSTLFSILWILFGLIVFVWFQGFTKPFDKWFIKTIKFLKIYDFVNKHIQKSYKSITPIKPRKIAFFGEKVEYVHKWFWFFGKKRENRVKIWLPDHGGSWSKREINQGHRNK